MMKSKKTFSISEVAEFTGFKPHVIRFYEKEFGLNIPRSENNRRYFTNKEIEELKYIQKLQNEGFNNKQIKLILNNEESKDMTLSSVDEVAVTSIDMDRVDLKGNEAGQLENVLMAFKDEILKILGEYNYKNEIHDLRERVEQLAQKLDNTDNDVLICENAKLKLKLKEKSYEVAELKDKLKRLENQKPPLFQRFLKTKSI